jgi:hypothetical protein
MPAVSWQTRFEIAHCTRISLSNGHEISDLLAGQDLVAVHAVERQTTNKKFQQWNAS